MDYRTLGRTELRVSCVALGCWPIAGMTSLDVNEADSLATVRACFDLGINFLDTAYCYGRGGESESLIRRAIGNRRHELVIATKGGIEWDAQGAQVKDARRETLRRQCDESLRRLGTDFVDLLYLHAPDPRVPLTEQAQSLAELQREGKTRAVGVSNFTLEQLREFHAVCPIQACQPKYNMLQREIEREIVPWCLERQVSLMVYWPLLKGLLAGKLPRDFVFLPADGRTKYPMFQGAEWQRNQDLVDELRDVARSAGKTVAQVVINWTIQQPGITTALCGAKRVDQITENAGGADWKLTAPQLQRIDEALARRGAAVSQGAVRA